MFENMSLNTCLRSKICLYTYGISDLLIYHLQTKDVQLDSFTLKTGPFSFHLLQFFPFVGLLAPSNLPICIIIKTNNCIEKPRIPLVWVINFWHNHSRNKNSVWFPNPVLFWCNGKFCVSKKWNCQAVCFLKTELRKYIWFK